MNINKTIGWNYRLLLLIGSIFILECIYPQYVEQFATSIKYIDAQPNFKPNIKANYSSDSSPSLIHKHLQQQFFKHGYLSFSIDTVISNEKNKQYYIYVGKQFKLNKITITNNEFEYLSSKHFIKKKLSPKFIENTDSNIYLALQNQGYPYATISKEIALTESDASLLYTISKNQYVSFDRLKCSPENLISTNYIARITGVIEDDPYNASATKRIKQNIKQSKIFKVDSVFSYISGNKSHNIVKLKPINYNNFSALAGLQTDNNNKSEITGRANISLTNAFKKGETIKVDWQKPETLSQQLETDFELPYIFKSPIGIKLNALIDKQDSTFTNTQLTSGFLIPIINFGRLSANVKWINSSVNQNSTNNLNSTKSLQYGLGYMYSLFDDPLLPKTGWLFKTNIFTGSQTQQHLDKAGSKTTILEWQGGFDFAFLLPIGSIYISNNWAAIKNDSLKTNNLYRLGGTNSMRGFNEKSIYTKNYFYTNVEYRLYLNSESYVYLLYDTGFFQEPEKFDYTTSNRNALGFGMNIRTIAGYLSISYAIGKVGYEPFNVRQGKIHIGYQNRF
ncbi:MAG: hypothetical protein PF517_12600 [Salinivirgaceae bacterium]|jgi:outer membrane protein insertion porin family|nr:hypothetical protein [Salinivirgaceae bacterium]